MVWSAAHKRSGVKVAVKALSAVEPNRFGRFDLWQEARLAAGMDHPNIIQLLDFGVVTTKECEAIGGKIPVDSRYLVMELARGGSLLGWICKLPWSHLSELCFQVLDALAHAHARDVIHLDIKPSNLLMDQDHKLGASSTPWVKLTDFGVSRLVRGALKRGDFGGTPLYMAPEQIRGAWAEVGPQTDLYSLGCTLWALLTGRPPFPVDSQQDAMIAHLYRAPPALRSAVAFPEGLEDWLLRLLNKEPRQRFLRAAEAAEALRELGEATLPPQEGPQLDEDERPTLKESEQPTRLFTGIGFSPTDPLPEGRIVSLSSESLRVTSNWRPPKTEVNPTRLVDAGLSLFRYRTPRFVGREEIRDQIWSTLLAVREDHQPRTLVLRGPSGFGTTRLLEWAGMRAHEVGVVDLVRIRGNDGGHQEVLDGFRRWFRLGGLGLKECELRMEQELKFCGVQDAWLSARLAQLLGTRQPDLPQDAWPILRRLLEIRGAVRTVLVLVDDAQWVKPIEDFAREIGSAAVMGLECRVMVLMGVRAEEDSRTGREEWKESLGDMAEVLSVEALLPLEQVVFVRDILHLEAGLAGQVVALTGGVPADAFRLVASWIEAEALVPGPNGYLLAEENREVVARQGAWVGPLERVEQGDFLPLEIAAALGRSWQEEQWVAATGRPTLLKFGMACREAGLVRYEDGAFSFVSPALRIHLANRAQEAQRWAKHHRRCLESGMSKLSEAGRHLLEAGEPETALEQLMAQLPVRLLHGDMQEAWAVYRQAQRSSKRLGLTPEDRRPVELLLMKARIHKMGKEERESAHCASEALKLAQAGGWDDLKACALRIQGQGLVSHRDPMLGLEILRKARELALSLGLSEEAIRSLISMANHQAYRGDKEQAVRLAEEAREEADAEGDAELRLLALLCASYVAHKTGSMSRSVDLAEQSLSLAKELGVFRWTLLAQRRLVDALALGPDPQRARELALECLRAYEQGGQLGQAVQVLHCLFGLEREAKNLDQAEIYIHRAVEISRYAGTVEWMFSCVNLSLIHAIRGQYSQAERFCEGAVETAQEYGHRELEVAGLALELLCACAGERWEEAAQKCDDLETPISVLKDTHKDLRWTLEQSIQHAMSHRKASLARRIQRFIVTRFTF